MAPLLQTTELAVSFGGVRALDGVDLMVEPGRLVGLIGPNGAGKSTFIDAVTGFVASTGRVEFAGRDISGAPAYRRARAGVGRTWQTVELFDDLTVAENLLVAAEPSRLGWAVADLLRPRRRGAEARVEIALAGVGLEGVADHLPNRLSQGQRKLAGVARALAAEPALVCLDEPAAGLDPAESAALGAQLRATVDAGTAILLVDHDMGLVLGICDDIYVLEFGRVIAHGTPANVRADDRVIAAYLGENTASDAR
jgi:branched-chain amino acid transport system ATP-binding protein